MNKIFSLVETDTEFLLKQDAVISFVAKLKVLTGRTIPRLSNEVIAQQTKLMHQLLAGHHQMSVFLDNIESAQPDVAIATYI